MPKNSADSIVKFIYEAGILSKTPRSGLWFLGTGKQTVAEHIMRATMIGYTLGKMTPKADTNKVVLLCLFHDLGEGRTSDLNYVHQRYGRLAEAQAINDIAASVPFGPHIKSLFQEFEDRETLESKLAKDADQLEWLATMRDEEEKGNKKAAGWAKIARKRLKTPAGKQLGRGLMNIHPDSWWFDQSDNWFVDRKKKDQKWRK